MNLKSGKRDFSILLFSVYMIVAAIISFILLLITIIRNSSFDWVITLAILTALSLILFSGINNLKILISRGKVAKRALLINLILSALQAVIIFTNGFYFKYTQGFELIGFVHIDSLTKAASWDLSNRNFAHDLIFNFKDASGTTVGLNFIGILLTMFYYYKYSNSKSLPAST